MKEIVLDKSYLDAATPEQILALHSKHRLLMPDVLFYELITTNEASMRNCFNKFPEISNPVSLIPNVGTLLRYEMTTRKPCTPLYDQRERAAFCFNSELRTGAFQFTAAQSEERTNQEAIIKQKTEEFFKLAMMVATFFPEINGIPYADLPAQISGAKKTVAIDITAVRAIYAKLAEAEEGLNSISSDTLNPNWALFRWIQVRCLYSLDLIFRYDGCLPSNPTTRFWTKIEHDMLDSEYVILASLSGAFACNENRMIEFFRLICPNGVLFETSTEK